MKSLLPRIEISLPKIRHNARQLCELYRKKGLSVMGVSKAILGDPLIALAMIQGGVKYIADSRIENILKMKQAGVATTFVLLRTALSQAELVVSTVDISLNTELATIQELSHYAQKRQKTHQILIMVELGDLREGVMPRELSNFIQKTLAFPYIKIVGLGCNLACYGGVKPDNHNMNELSVLTDTIEKEFLLKLPIISGGNSANYQWYQDSCEVGRINNLRLGESILLGCETVNRQVIPGLYTDAFRLIAEVIESKDKPSLPSGEIGRDAFGNVPNFLNRGIHRRVIIALGRQDVLVSGLKSSQDVKILGSSSDHLVLDCENKRLRVGSEVSFNLDYGGLLAVMTSPFVSKSYAVSSVAQLS
jgi:ornithine racemase